MACKCCNNQKKALLPQEGTSTCQTSSSMPLTMYDVYVCAQVCMFVPIAIVCFGGRYRQKVWENACRKTWGQTKLNPFLFFASKLETMAEWKDAHTTLALHRCLIWFHESIELEQGRIISLPGPLIAPATESGLKFILSRQATTDRKAIREARSNWDTQKVQISQN